MSLPSHAKYQDLNIVLESIYSLHRKAEHQAAESLLEKNHDLLEQSPLHKKISQLIEQVGKYEQNKFNAKAYTELLSLIKTPIQQSEMPLYQGWLHFLTGFHLKNSDELKLAAAFFQEGFFYNELYEVYYWMDNFRLLPSEEKYITFLRTYPIKSIYSVIKGNRYFNDLVPLTQIQKDQAQAWLHDNEDQEFDCWIIANNSITPANYSSIELGDTSYLDIYSGLINDRGEFIFLFLGEINCLSFLISAQLIGASLTQIAEFLNRNEEEAQVLLKDIQKMGIKIINSNGLYFLRWEAKPNIIIPRSLKVIGLHEFVKKKYLTFTKSKLIELLQLTQFGADALMKKWSLAGLIRPVEKNESEHIWKFL